MSRFAPFLLLVSLVYAHEGAYCAGCFGANRKDLDSQLSIPLNAQTKNWFWRGLDPSSAGVMKVTGGTLDVDIACSKTNSKDDTGQMCFTDDNGSLHKRPDGTNSGCGLGYSQKPFEQIKPEDLTLISILKDCPRADGERPHSFALPADLPAGNATAAFLWIPPVESAADEMYMTGISLQVDGQNKGALTGGQPAKYWAVSGVGRKGQRPIYNKLGDGALQLGGAIGNATSSTINKGASEQNGNDAEADGDASGKDDGQLPDHNPQASDDDDDDDDNDDKSDNEDASCDADDPEEDDDSPLQPTGSSNNLGAAPSASLDLLASSASAMLTHKIAIMLLNTVGLTLIAGI